MVGIERGELPLVLLLRGGSTRSFLVGRGPLDEASVRRLLREGGNAAALRFEYTGMWGLPARLWRRLGDALPFLPLHLLDFLPCAARPRRVLAPLARQHPLSPRAATPLDTRPTALPRFGSHLDASPPRPYSLTVLVVLLGFGALIVLIGSVPLPDDAAEGGEDSKKED